MAKNTHIAQLQAAAFKGRQEGILLGLDLAAIAFNHSCGLDSEALNSATEEVQEILNEIKNSKDFDRIRTDIVNELTDIHGKESREFWLKRYISLTTGI
jgi:hypothetical protein